MNTHSLLPLAALLLAGPAQVCAIELGRLDLTAPGAMISTCGGMGQGGSVGDKHGWQPGRFTCNAEMTASPSAVIGQSATYTEGPILVDTHAWGESVMGQTRLYAHSRARQDSGAFPLAVATGGWVDMLTFNPADPAQIGQEASFSFVIDVGGTMSGQGANHSYNSLVRFGLRPYKNDAFFAPGPESDFFVQGQGQQGFPYDHTVNQLVTLTTTVTLGTAFELGVFARAWAGNASYGSVQAFSEATADFSNTITWAGISALTLNGNAVPYTLASASGIDWTQPYVAAVPEPTTWALWACGLVGVAWRRRRVS